MSALQTPSPGRSAMALGLSMMFIGDGEQEISRVADKLEEIAEGHDEVDRQRLCWLWCSLREVAENLAIAMTELHPASFPRDSAEPLDEDHEQSHDQHQSGPDPEGVPDQGHQLDLFPEVVDGPASYSSRN